MAVRREEQGSTASQPLHDIPPQGSRFEGRTITSHSMGPSIKRLLPSRPASQWHAQPPLDIILSCLGAQAPARFMP